VQKILLWNNSCIRKNYDISKSYVLQASLPETTYFCIENKLAERPPNRRQPEQRLQPIKTDY